VKHPVTPAARYAIQVRGRSMRDSLALTMEDFELPKAATFHLDGTLLDSVDLHALAWQGAMLEFGHDVSFDQVRSQIGKGGTSLFPSSCPLTNNATTAKNWKSGAAIASRPSICHSCVLFGGPGSAATRARRWSSDRGCFLRQEG
jgi:hypothetical protein